MGHYACIHTAWWLAAAALDGARPPPALPPQAATKAAFGLVHNTSPLLPVATLLTNPILMILSWNTSGYCATPVRNACQRGKMAPATGRLPAAVLALWAAWAGGGTHA